MAKRKLPDQLTDQNVVDMEFFHGDIEAMYEDADKIEELAARIDNDLGVLYFNKNNRDMMSRGTLPFVSEQLKTLAQLRTAKSSTLNQIMSNKLKLAQLSQSKTKIGEGSADATAIAREFQKLFLDPKNKRAEDLPENQFKGLRQKPKDIIVDEDSALDARLSELESSGKLQFTDNEQAIKYEKCNVQFQIIHTNGILQFVAVDGLTNKILGDYPPTLLPKTSDLEKAVITATHYECANGKKYAIYQ